MLRILLLTLSLTSLSSSLMGAAGEHWIVPSFNPRLCQLKASFAQRSEALNPLTIRYAPSVVEIASLSEDDIQIFPFRVGGEQYLSLSLRLSIRDNQATLACIQQQFPQALAERIAPTAIDLAFFSPLPDLSYEIEGGRSIDIFQLEQWVSVTLRSRNLYQYLQNDPVNFFQVLFAGQILWYGLGSQPIKQSLDWDPSTLESLARRIQNEGGSW